MAETAILDYDSIKPLDVPLYVKLSKDREQKAVKRRHRQFATLEPDKPQVKIQSYIRKLAILRTGRTRPLNNVIFLPGTEPIYKEYSTRYLCDMLRLPRFSQLWKEDDIRPYLEGDGYSKIMLNMTTDDSIIQAYRTAIHNLLKDNKIKAVVGGKGQDFEGDWSFERLFMQECATLGKRYIFIPHSILNKRIETYGHPSLCYNSRDARRQGCDSKVIGNWRYELDSKTATQHQAFEHKTDITLSVLILSQPIYLRLGMARHNEYISMLLSVVKDYLEGSKGRILVKQHPDDAKPELWTKHLRPQDIFIRHEPGILHSAISASDVTIGMSSNALVDSIALGKPGINISYPNFPNIFHNAKSIKTVSISAVPRELRRIYASVSSSMIDSITQTAQMKADVKQYFGFTDGDCIDRAVRFIHDY